MLFDFPVEPQYVVGVLVFLASARRSKGNPADFRGCPAAVIENNLDGAKAKSNKSVRSEAKYSFDDGAKAKSNDLHDSALASHRGPGSGGQ
jgi:hypothetical protein